MISTASIENVTVDLGDRSYSIKIGAGLLGRAADFLKPHLQRDRIFCVCDETVAGLYLKGFTATLKSAGVTLNTYTLPSGEPSKSLKNLSDILDWLLENGAERSDTLIAFGGGVTGDITGLAASLMKRGMGFMQIPTTLLSQVDSSVGGKTAINSPFGKNLIGAFYQPQLVLADIDVLKTLPKRELRAGFAEVIKYGLLGDAGFYKWIEGNASQILALETDQMIRAIKSSCEAKARIVAKDEREAGVRALLNLGHTFGHAFEAANKYGPELLHGEGVALGMQLAFSYSERLGLSDTSDTERVQTLLSACGYDTDIKSLGGGPYPAETLVQHMSQDKKASAGQVPLILVKGIGNAFVYKNADLADVQAFLETQ